MTIGLKANADGSGAIQVGGSDAITVSTGLNVGIGNTAPTAPLDVTVGTGNFTVSLQGAGNTALTASASLNLDAAGVSSAMVLKTVGTERMRIDSNGAIMMNTATPVSTGILSILATGGTTQGIGIKNSNTSTVSNLFFRNSSDTTVGTIQSSTTATSYNTSSDYRLKENVQPMTSALATVTQLKPCTYKWKLDGSDSQGFIAHELQEVVPDCVSGTKDEVDAEGNPVYQGIDTSFLVATLTAAIQELKAEVDALRAQVEAQ